MTILLSDPRVHGVPLVDNGDPLVRLDRSLGRHSHVRSGLAQRLADAQSMLPPGVRLHVVEGHRSAAAQAAIVASYSAELCAVHPGISPDDLARLSSRFVAPLAVAPHVAGAAVDLTLVGSDGVELDLGTPIDATPEQSAGRCYFDAVDISAEARAYRELLAGALTGAGLVNYPTEWWHWSFGDRYWALMTGADHALYGPADLRSAA
ncbi:M15 family metallopeptidase [Nocardioides sp.]|uniref:M15 family metallopeptidase n=1 Tax=Nocardioides sp. TaxID=35761 RepID=UPI003D0A33AB